ncbi:MAG TPA: shikimate kinase [Terracidiphilus sp.]|jgi:shikimate kinase
MKTPEQAEATKRIVLTGFMGSGKTTVGPLLAERLGWTFVDVDDVIAAEAGTTIPEIFRSEGETEFRRREREVIFKLLDRGHVVLALGGGAIEDAATRERLIMSAETLLIHLEVELATTLARCKGTENLRPVLADEANLKDRYERRLPLYRMAHVTLKVDTLSPGEVADAIVRAIG